MWGGVVSKVILFSLSASWLTGVSLLPAKKAREAKVSYARQILPILSDKCFLCHGPDSGSRKANLRLDQASSAFADRGGEWAIVPGKPESSLVVKRIHNPDTPMPPRASNKVLSAEEKKLIERWIAEGAVYGKVWSFEPLPANVPVPKIAGTWAKDDLDRFIQDKLRNTGLTPSPGAAPLRWLRRVTLDLTGLPPTEEEIAAFNKAPDYEGTVDRLLASPHFGERMAVEWLDAARYSDSYGYQSDLLMPTWPYRDWVVRAFNSGMPYDEFLTEQIAGDLLPGAKRDQILATAFNRLHRQSNEGGSIAEEFKAEYATDRVDTFGTAVLGLTLGCARCHDHKFDPITQREYYQLFAYFNSIDEFGLLLSTEIVPTPSLLLPTPEQEPKLEGLKRNLAAAESAVADTEKGAGGRFENWLAFKATAVPLPAWTAVFNLDTFANEFANSGASKAYGHKLGAVELVEGHKGKAALLDGDNGIAFRGLPAKERWDPFTWSFWVSDPRAKGPVVLLHRTGGTDVGFCGFDLMLEEGYLTARVMRHWPGNAVAIRTVTQIPKDSWNHIAWSYDGSGHASGLKLWLDGQPARTEVVADSLWKKINAYGDLAGSGGDWAFGQRFRDAGFRGGKLDEVVFSDRAVSDIEVAHLFKGQALSLALATRSPELRSYYVSAIDEPSKAAREAARKAHAELANFEEGIREISVMEEKREIPAYVLARGQYDAPKTEENRVRRGVPAALPEMALSGPNNRLALARWATSKDHPLTARVAVNRLWQMLFGTGLVETSENFGTQGSQPSHPELLDFLARRFVDEGWDVKKAIRRIVLSATYRQDSAGGSSVEGLGLNRGPSGRLSAEMVRDTVLAASGLLNDTLGGPPVNPYQPAGIWQENNTMSPGFVQSKGADLYRRSLYSTWKRTTPVPSMLLFDANTREACMVRRPSTNTPLQALVLLNDVQYVEAARVLAELVLKSPGSDEARVSRAFVRLAGRPPEAGEMAVLLRTLAEQRIVFRGDLKGAMKLCEVGDSVVDAKLRPSEVAAMTVVVQTILNSDAVIWKR